jgi:hypothetical protein
MKSKMAYFYFYYKPVKIIAYHEEKHTKQQSRGGSE